MKRKLMRGNDAIIAGAILAGCRSFFGYPITPASEIAHAAGDVQQAIVSPLHGSRHIVRDDAGDALPRVLGPRYRGG